MDNFFLNYESVVKELAFYSFIVFWFESKFWGFLNGLKPFSIFSKNRKKIFKNFYLYTQGHVKVQLQSSKLNTDDIKWKIQTNSFLPFLKIVQILAIWFSSNRSRRWSASLSNFPQNPFGLKMKRNFYSGSLRNYCLLYISHFCLFISKAR